MDINKLRAATPAPAPPPHSIKVNTRTRAGGDVPPADTLAWCLATFSGGPFPAVGSRNAWLTALGYFCNERGVSLAELESRLVGSYAAPDFDAREIAQTLRGIYTREAAAHGSKPWAAAGNKPAFSAFSGQKGNRPATPLPDTFPAAVYDALPDYLRRCCAPFDGHEKAVMLLGTLAVLSGCFPGVSGTYNKRRHWLNLFVFVIAPAASGKGTLGWARKLAQPWHKRLTDASKAARAEYDAALAAYKNAGKAKANLTPPPDAPPAYKLLYLPGNTTAAALSTAMAENDGRGIMCETETDTLSGALGADFGNFSDVLRKAFHHEPVSLLRKTDRQHLDLERPALSIALTGTPGQLPRLMPTAEDGLVSRFVFYIFEQIAVWQDVGPSAGPALDPYVDALAGELSRMIEATPAPDETGAYPVEIMLAPADWQRLNAAGAAGLDEAAQTGGAATSQAFRLGLIAWRIAGLLTVLRCFENGQAPAGRLVADSADVGTALAMMDTARAHALAVLTTLPNPGAAAGKFAAKAEQETRVQELHAQGLSVREIAEQVGIHYSTVSRWLNLP